MMVVDGGGWVGWGVVGVGGLLSRYIGGVRCTWRGSEPVWPSVRR